MHNVYYTRTERRIISTIGVRLYYRMFDVNMSCQGLRLSE